MKWTYTLNLWSFNVLLIKFCENFTLNFINFHEKYIKFYVHVHKYILFSYK